MKFCREHHAVPCSLALVSGSFLCIWVNSVGAEQVTREVSYRIQPPVSFCGLTGERRSLSVWKGGRRCALIWLCLPSNISVGRGAGPWHPATASAAAVSPRNVGVKLYSKVTLSLLAVLPRQHSGAEQLHAVILRLCLFLKSLLSACWELRF